ncbi:MAG: SEC-C domain-containing protein [Lachnospiraceae bacterium]|nr:SEC-C domain-containing protein [Lachnospiraceae bacterium]
MSLSDGDFSLSDGNSLQRNVPCPCGSGKKYKKCCGKPQHFYHTLI